MSEDQVMLICVSVQTAIRVVDGASIDTCHKCERGV